MAEICSQCGHPFNPHVLFATNGNPMDGGIVLCPEPRCPCYIAWSVEGLPTLDVPSPERITTLRAEIQRMER